MRHCTPPPARVIGPCRPLVRRVVLTLRRAAPDSGTNAGSVATSEEPAFRVAGTLTSPAPPATAWAALTDYAAAPSIFASVAACAELGPCPTTPGAVRIEQAVAWSFLVFGGAFKMTLAVADAPPPPDAPPGTRALAFTLVDSRYLSSFRGLWTVAPEAGGGCAVTHELAVTPRAPPPKAVRKLVQSLFARQVAALLADLEAELERRGAAV